MRCGYMVTCDPPQHWAISTADAGCAIVIDSVTLSLLLLFPSLSADSHEILDDSHHLLLITYIIWQSYSVWLSHRPLNQLQKSTLVTMAQWDGGHSCDSEHGDLHLRYPSEDGLSHSWQAFLRSPRREAVYQMSALSSAAVSFFHIDNYICFRYCFFGFLVVLMMISIAK